MNSVDWRQVSWSTVILYSLYVLVFGLALAFLGLLLGIAASPEFPPARTLLVAFALIMVSYRAGLKVERQPLLHGLLIGLLVGVIDFVFTAATTGVGVPEIAGLLLQLLGGLLGGRMAQRVLRGAQ